ncbi:hypothetical protein JAO73_22420 [Hymenobacter sp. BT523]|uniref:hypothetical protein n=1 Tax=Hymenobacter sp. BT523 TaxID=2795725 RepID=UPI0018EDFF8D|nr:hypothetical protein [Hymenobacter sp. BT523]MBJ6111792.1 hypothetical protein [Hymenobacter sp. BT523]
MENHTPTFDEHACRTLLADVRLWLDDGLSNIRLGRIHANSKHAQRVRLLGEVYDRFHDLVVMTVMDQLIDAVHRQSNRLLLVKNAFLTKEVTYYRSILLEEQATSAEFYDFALGRLLNNKQRGRQA